MLCLLLVLWGLAPSKNNSYFVYLKAPNGRSIRARKGPRPNSPVSCILTTPKYPLRVVAEYDNWKQVAVSPTDVVGWVHKSFVVSGQKRYGATLSTCSLIQKDTNHVVAKVPAGLVIELLHKVGNKWFVLVKDPTDGKKMTGFVPCSVVWGE